MTIGRLFPNNFVYLDKHYLLGSRFLDRKIKKYLYSSDFRDCEEINSVLNQSPIWERSQLHPYSYNWKLPNFNLMASYFARVGVNYIRANDFTKISSNSGLYWTNSMFSFNLKEYFKRFDFEKSKLPKFYAFFTQKKIMEHLTQRYVQGFSLDKKDLFAPSEASESIPGIRPVYQSTLFWSSVNLNSEIRYLVNFLFEHYFHESTKKYVSGYVASFLDLLGQTRIFLTYADLAFLALIYRHSRLAFNYTNKKFDDLLKDLNKLLNSSPQDLSRLFAEKLNQRKSSVNFYSGEAWIVPKRLLLTEEVKPELKDLLRPSVEINGGFELDELRLVKPEDFIAEMVSQSEADQILRDSPLKALVERILQSNQINFRKNEVDFPFVFDFAIETKSERSFLILKDGHNEFFNLKELQTKRWTVFEKQLNEEKKDLVYVTLKKVLHFPNFFNRFKTKQL